jgi:hypothetical protein
MCEAREADARCARCARHGTLVAELAPHGAHESPCCLGETLDKEQDRGIGGTIVRRHRGHAPVTRLKPKRQLYSADWPSSPGYLPPRNRDLSLLGCRTNRVFFVPQAALARAPHPPSMENHIPSRGRGKLQCLPLKLNGGPGLLWSNKRPGPSFFWDGSIRAEHCPVSTRGVRTWLRSGSQRTLSQRPPAVPPPECRTGGTRRERFPLKTAKPSRARRRC